MIKKLMLASCACLLPFSAAIAGGLPVDTKSEKTIVATSQSENSQDNWNKIFDFKDLNRWIFRLRLLNVDPDEDSNISTIGGQADVDDAFVPEFDITYFFTKNIAAELILAVTPHDVVANNTALGNVDLGDVWLLPPTLNLQYHFCPDSKFRPYVGAGINYTVFFNEDSGAVDSIDYDNGFGYSLQAGFDYEIDKNWAINVDVKKVHLDTDVTLYSGATRVDADVDLDPWIFGVGVAYRF